MTQRRRGLLLLVTAASIIALTYYAVSAYRDFSPESFMVRVEGQSPVDVSILDPLADYPMYDLEELRARIESLEDREGSVFQLDWEGDMEGGSAAKVDGIRWRYDFCISDKGMPGGGRLAFEIYDTSEDAKRLLEYARTSERDSEYATKAKFDSDDVEVLLWPILNRRDAENFYTYSKGASFYTQVRIGNILLRFHEGSSDKETLGVHTNEALRQIVEALKP